MAKVVSVLSTSSAALVAVLLVAMLVVERGVAQTDEAAMHHERGRMHADREPGQRVSGMHSMARHRLVMHTGLPDAYGGLTSPLTATPATLAQGRSTYVQVCAACHGDTGEGDGPASAGLSPSPSNLRHLPRMPAMSSDAYLYWTIAEGGAPIGSAMPAFKETLSSDDIWSVIAFLRDLGRP